MKVPVQELDWKAWAVMFVLLMIGSFLAGYFSTTDWLDYILNIATRG